MEGIFTLPYSEFEVINQIQKHLSKKIGSIYIPTSRQQKGIDFIIFNSKTKKSITFQVKSSRSYLDSVDKQKTKKVKYRYNFWFSNFRDKYKRGNSDYYILFGLYPIYTIKNNIKSKSKFWKPLILCFKEKEMFNLLKKVKTKREKKQDRFFGISFDDEKKIYGVRGFDAPKDLSKYLLENKFKEILDL